jgi:hypothetical protein
MTDNSIHRAVEITKAAIPAENGIWLNHPDLVAKFVEVVANKLEELAGRKA